jgi:Tfp pilus assembly protein PilV
MTMVEDDSASAGFSTVEILVAFVVLSLGLGLAVQSISQASMSLRRADDAGKEALLLRRIVSEELPRLVNVYTGKTIEAAGPSWRIEVQPISDQGPRQALRATIEIRSRESAAHSTAYTTILPVPVENRQGKFLAPVPR